MQILKFNNEPGTPERTSESVGQEPLYGSFFGLRERPFALSPNPRFVFVSNRQREALSSLRYGLSTPHGFMLMTGEAGTGKTTMLRAVLNELDETKVRCVILSNPTLSRGEFYEVLARSFGLSAQAATSKAKFLEELQTTLETRLSEGIVTGLIVDEAQSMPAELLEEVRLLGNMETSSTKLLNIVLSGQTELLDRLQEPSAQALTQRIALRCELKRFDRDETAAYIAGRLRIAGGSPQDIFTQQAVMAIHTVTGGLPRMINVLCENALIGGVADQVKPVTARIVQQVASEFEFPQPVDSPESPAVVRIEQTPESLDQSGRRGLFGLAKRRFSFFS